MTSAGGDGGDALERFRADVVKRLRARRAEIEEAIFARVSDQWFDPTGADDPEYVTGLRAAGAAALDYVLVGIERSEQSIEPVPVAALAQARRAARAGVGLDTVLRRYLAGYAVVEGFVMREAEHADQNWLPRIGSRPPKSALRDVLQAMSALVDRLITTVSNAYGEEIERSGHSRSGHSVSPRHEIPVPPGHDIPAGEGSDRPGPAVSGGAAISSARGVATSRARTSRRDRILQAMVEVVSERGFGGASVKLVTGRAGVSTRTFYEEFEGLRDCFVAVLDLALERAGGLIARAFAREDRWQDGMLGALASLLVFFDSEPALTRVWFVEALAVGSWALERREQVAGRLRSVIVEHWVARGATSPDPVAATGVMASVLGLIHTHLVTERPEPLIELLGPLMGLVTSLYLDKQDVAREVQRGVQVTRDIQAGDTRWSPPWPHGESSPAPDATPAVAGARRARECLLFLAEQGRRGLSPSNREVATGVGVTHLSQVSRLLSHLAEENLVVKRSAGAGKRNAWRLTPRGEEVAQALAERRA
jgi:AcrR family transcriptional regulator